MAEQIDSKIPKIRFTGFEAEWKEATVSDFVVSLDAGVSVNSGDRTATSTELGVLKTSAVTNGVFEADENKVVLTECEQSRLKESVSGGTIIISRMNTPALVGANAYVESSHENLFLPDRLWAAKPRDGTSMRFLACILGSEIGRDALSKLAKGTSGSMKNITKPDVLAFSVMAPSPTEQTQIGEYFRELDRLIGLHQRKHDKLLTLKKAMLQKMFPQRGATTPEIRFRGFSGEWVENTLKTATEITTGFPFKSSDFSESGTYLVITNGNIQNELSFVDASVGNRISIQNSAGLNQFLLRVGDILVTMDGSVGRTAKVRETNQILAQRVGRLVAKSDSEFLYQVLNTGTFLEEMTTISHGGTIKHISLSEIGDYLFLAPSDLEEQQKIGTYFRTLDELISKHAIQLQKLKQIKSACLEKMFV